MQYLSNQARMRDNSRSLLAYLIYQMLCLPSRLSRIYRKLIRCTSGQIAEYGKATYTLLYEVPYTNTYMTHTRPPRTPLDAPLLNLCVGTPPQLSPQKGTPTFIAQNECWHCYCRSETTGRYCCKCGNRDPHI